MNMILLTGLSVALALSVMTTNNFYVEKVTNASINDFKDQTKTYASNIMRNINSGGSIADKLLVK